MLIGLISDTHIPTVAKALPHQVKEIFRDVELILHAGDIYDLSVLDELEQLAPVLAAYGDDDDHALNDGRLKEQHLITIESFRICLVHQMPTGVFRGWMLGTDEMDKFRDNTDILVFGHNHRSVVDRANGVLLVGPGSPTFPNYELKLGTVGLLNLSPGKAEAHIVELARGHR